ncbi:hypothetical protein CKAH01_05161 [Colletotrichum kahawae]|uniref:Uncharacterized protein n=1 Tax=Colletotrichum kahawae TaxID=34407 RepID=A0AAD9YGT9_COLKA|nr:hypothetical protein CKAH01_05161 [Colletotrichum kahawae]
MDTGLDGRALREEGGRRGEGNLGGAQKYVPFYNVDFEGLDSGKDPRPPMEGTERGPGRLKALGICNVAFHFQGAIDQPCPPSAGLLPGAGSRARGFQTPWTYTAAVPYQPTVSCSSFIVSLPVLNVKDAWNSISNWEPGLWINVIMDGMNACPIGPSVRSRLAVCIL